MRENEKEKKKKEKEYPLAIVGEKRETEQTGVEENHKIESQNIKS